MLASPSTALASPWSPPAAASEEAGASSLAVLSRQATSHQSVIIGSANTGSPCAIPVCVNASNVAIPGAGSRIQLSAFPDCSRTLQPRHSAADGTAAAASTWLDLRGHLAAWPVTWRYVFLGIWAGDRVAANDTAHYGTAIAPETKIMYGVGTDVPDRSRTLQ